MEMVTCIDDLVKEWLKEKKARAQVIDVVMKEQFIEILLEEAKVWVAARNYQEGR